MENSTEAVILLDRLGNIRRVNQAFANASGYAPQELEGRNIRRFLLEGEERSLFEEIYESVWQGGYWQGEIVARRKTGETFRGALKVSSVLSGGGGERYYVGQLIFWSRAPSPGAGAGGLYPSGMDSLTGLPGRPLFVDRLQQALSQAHRQGRCVAVMFLDLDRFQFLNDSLGWAAGDTVLLEISRRLGRCLRTSDSVGRIGADEFALLLADIDEEREAVRNAGVVARKVYESLALPLSLAGEELTISAAMGITLSPQDGMSAEVMMKNAEVALQHARRKGWNNYQFFSSEMTETARRRFALETSLRSAIERGELLLYYQPQVDLKSGRVIGAEALARWRHPERGMVPPGEFIPVAEETGLIVPIGEWVLRTACRQLAEWRDIGLAPIRVGVNLSAKQFQRQDLAQMVADLIAEFGLDPHYLDLEITESAIMEDVERAVAMLNRISALGVTLSIDDFGTGYSSLAQLRQFPFKTLKIDRTFVRSIQENTSDAAIVSAIIAMAHSLNQNVIVEGLETQEQLAILRELKCNEMQGFLFSAAVPAVELTEMLRMDKRLL
ncbi:MAG: EAL domain-containing protein [Magnetococcales bacterium]|nr:EAL domain-containing protein [Magnetococcales bacterium]